MKGNESYRVGDYDDAIQHYSKSIAFDDSNGVVYANRAMVYLKKELFDLAENDCDVSILIDSNYLKAFSRRGMIRFKRGKYFEVSKITRTAINQILSNLSF